MNMNELNNYTEPGQAYYNLGGVQANWFTVLHHLHTASIAFDVEKQAYVASR